MGKVLYRYGQYIVRGCEDGYVVIKNNTKLDKHAHCKSMKGAISLCKLADKKKLPKTNNEYFINSLIRISTNKSYIRELENRRDNYEKI